MLKTLISSTISHKELSFRHDSTPITFEVLVVNESDRFASFQLELIAPGGEAYPKRRWYTLSPEVSAKKPPGDSTKFRVTILDTPIPGFAGLVNVTVRIFSLELGEDRKLLRLQLEPGSEIALDLDLPVKQFQTYPLELVEIPVQIHNPSHQKVQAIVNLMGIPSGWLSNGAEQRIQLEQGASSQIYYQCVIPETTQARSDRYPFTVQVMHSGGLPANVSGVLEILPTGYLDFDCSPRQQQLPARGASLRQWWANLAKFTLQLSNQSNVATAIVVEIEGEERDQCTFQLLPDQHSLQPGDSQPVSLSIAVPRPWIGWSKLLLFTVKATAPDAPIDLQNETQIIKLRVRPKLPLWMQLLIILLLLFGVWWFSWLNPENPWFGHKAAVNSVQFNGVGSELVSGADDQTIIQWNAESFFNPFANQQLRVLGQMQKSVRVVRYRPVDNNWVAAGLENGEIQLWHLDSREKPTILSAQKDDRVLSLAFTRDSRYLLSGHGSGQVLQWSLDQVKGEALPPQLSQPRLEQSFNFAIYGMTFVGGNDKELLVAGRYNRMELWNWETDATRPVDYPRPGGQDDYITSVSQAAHNPFMVASSDNQGYITLWNLRSCLLEDQPCQIIDEWQDGHGGKPVRQVAISEYGCYLTSAGTDGQVKLWVLTADGNRAAQYINGIVLRKRPKPINTVDIKVVGENILVAEGDDETQVNVYKEPRKPEMKCDVPRN